MQLVIFDRLYENILSKEFLNNLYLLKSTIYNLLNIVNKI